VRRQDLLINKIDWLVAVIYAILVFFGWLNIYAATYDSNLSPSIFSLDINSGRQLLWIGISLITIMFILVVDFKIYSSIAYFVFGFFILLLIGVLFTRSVGGASSWFEIGSFKFQPSELTKFATALAMAKFFNDNNPRFDRLIPMFTILMIIVLPMGLILLQPDAGTALVFGAFILVLYREGLNPLIIIIGLVAIVLVVLTLLIENDWYLVGGVAFIAALIVILWGKSLKLQRILMIIGGALIIIGIIFSVDYLVNEVLPPHQQKRIMVLFNPGSDPTGVEWNVTQSKIAIGSGGWFGKGYLQGTQTSGGYVPEQSTDFIFSTIGEEHGWIGSLLLIVLFTTMFMRIIYIAERQKSRFARVYGYAVVSIFFFHFMINIGMSIGLFPVIGIPLPFFSYGGSALWSFTILLFVLLKLDAHRMQVFTR
jgi:rod shape determining protein RodA